MLHFAIVDDEIEIGIIYQAFFKCEIDNNILDVVQYTDGHQFFENLDKGKKFDLILCDINMPLMDGFQLLEKFRTKLQYKTPVFMISAYDTPQYVDKCMGLGANKFFAKPIDFDVLKNAIAQEFQINLKF